MKFMQKLGKSLLLPVCCLPLCGILMGIGYLLCPASMQGGELVGIGPTIGLFLVKAGGALIDHIALLYGVFSYVTALVGFRAGFCFSAGATDLLFSASLPAAARTWLILPLGAAAFVVFYLVFRFLIARFHLPTPGSEDEAAPAEAPAKAEAADRVAGVDLQAILQGLGGVENVVSLDHCATRLRVELKDQSLLDEARIKGAGARGVVKPGPTSIQVVKRPDSSRNDKTTMQETLLINAVDGSIVHTDYGY